MTPIHKKIEHPRVRIAPSPTGFAHIGTGRTALFNWLIAKKYDGQFVLRLEDTDIARYKPEYEEALYEQLRWLGIDWDEGPDIGGPYGPYRQRERGNIYKKYIDQLLNEGKAYFCFCSPDELEAKKRDMEGRGEPIKYDGHCRHFSKEEIQNLINAGKPYVIRHKMPDKKISFHDLIRGKVEFDLNLIGDQIIAKNNGKEPLFNFANAVDDYEMKISHVLRAEEHLSNTPKQIAVCDLFNWPIPEFGHMPLILTPDRAKMSKRFGDVSIADYRNKGYLPKALINFVAFLGWHPSEKSGKPKSEMMTLDELIEDFDIERVQKAGAIFNQEKLDWMNGEYIKQMEIDELMLWSRPFLEKDLGKEKANSELAKKAVILNKDRIKKLSEIPEMVKYFFDLPDYEKGLLFWKDISQENLKVNLDKIYTLLSDIKEDGFNKEELEKTLMPEAEKIGRGEMLWPLRSALSGMQKSSGPFEILGVLGKTESLRRIKIALDKLN